MAALLLLLLFVDGVVVVAVVVAVVVVVVVVVVAMTDLNRSEYAQLFLANELLMVFITIIILLIQYGGCAILEHPSIADWLPMSASIWKLCYIRWLCLCDFINLVKFKQSDHGQIGVKRTTLLGLRTPTLLYRIKSPDRTLPAPGFKGPLAGKDADGKWKTCDAKEYTPSMCKALALAMLDSIDKAFVGGNSGGHADNCNSTDDFPRQVFSKFLVQHDLYSEENEIHADCKMFNKPTS